MLHLENITRVQYYLVDCDSKELCVDTVGVEGVKKIIQIKEGDKYPCIIILEDGGCTKVYEIIAIEYSMEK